MGEGSVISRGSATPLPQGVGPMCNPILGVLFYLQTHSLMQNYQISCGNTYGEGVVYRWPAMPAQRDRVPALPSFGGSFLFMHNPLLQNYQI